LILGEEKKPEVDQRGLDRVCLTSAFRARKKVPSGVWLELKVA
jgi:hypothetical protein